MEEKDIEQDVVAVEAAEESQDTVAETSSSDCDKQIEQLKAEKAELEDRYLRKHADFENYRKRVVKEKSDAVQYANSDFMKDLLDVLDNLGRAEQAMADSTDIAGVRDGVQMVHQSFVNLLTSKGLKKIEGVGTEFNPEHHQAIAQEADENVTVATVIEEYQAGYVLHDRVLRPSMVKVAMPSKS